MGNLYFQYREGFPDNLNKVFIETETKNQITYSDLEKHSSAYSVGFEKLGLNRGDRVTLQVNKSVEVIFIYLACLRSGLIFHPLNTAYKDSELRFFLDDAEPAVFICESTTFNNISDLNLKKKPANLFTLDSIQKLKIYEDHEILDCPDDEVAALLYSSGTTGRPKGVFRKENPPPSKTEQLTLDTAAFDPVTDFSICPGPAYHAAPLGLNINISLMAGVGVYLMDKWDAEKMLHLIDQYKCTHTHMVATMFHRILRLPEEVRSSYDLSSMKWILHGAAPCPVEVKRAIIEWFGPIVFEYYAATEGGGCYIDSKEWLLKPGSVGKANEGVEVKILDEEDQEVKEGMEGTIYFKAPVTGRFEYYKAKEKTSGAYRGDYFTMGDIGYRDSDGYYFLTGRSADTIISGGTNIYPQEIDDVLLAHQSVAEVCCIGVPNEEWGEEVKAVINLE